MKNRLGSGRRAERAGGVDSVRPGCVPRLVWGCSGSLSWLKDISPSGKCPNSVRPGAFRVLSNAPATPQACAESRAACDRRQVPQDAHPRLVGPAQAGHAGCRPPLRFRPSASRWDARSDCPKRGDRRRRLSNRGTSSPPAVPDSKAGISGPALALHNGDIVDGEISPGGQTPLLFLISEHPGQCATNTPQTHETQTPADSREERRIPGS